MTAKGAYNPRSMDPTKFKDFQIAQEAMKRKSGARGLRTILENCLLDIMYELPSMTNIQECVITEECVHQKGNPIFIYQPIKTHA